MELKNGLEIEYHKEAAVKYRWQVIEWVGNIPMTVYAGKTKKKSAKII